MENESGAATGGPVGKESENEDVGSAKGAEGGGTATGRVGVYVRRRVARTTSDSARLAGQPS
eukprot:2330844-Rhodomonas_salina.1